MATYRDIQDYIVEKYGYEPKSCWIAHAKELFGLNPKMAANRYSASKRANPCPPNKQDDLRRVY